MELSVNDMIKKPFSGRNYDEKLEIVSTVNLKVHTLLCQKICLVGTGIVMLLYFTTFDASKFLLQTALCIF